MHLHVVPQTPDPAPTLLEVVDRLARDPSRWPPLEGAPLDATRRAYAVIEETPAYTAWLVRWGFGAGVPLHDHGASRGVIHVLRGRLVERVLRGVDAAGPRWTRHPLTEGTTRLFAQRHLHEVRNLGAHEAWTIQVDAPRVASMSRYEVRDGRVEAVGLVTSLH